MNRRIVIVLLMMAVYAGGTGCTPKHVREARQVLTEADSLRLKGIFMTSPDDSLRIAEATKTLLPWRFVYAADYAKACFHYGRTLRAKGHYPEAMQCFLNVIHSRSRDCIIKGRAYSNIADLCQLEGNYDLAYDMHVISADCFKNGGNMQAYYYAINNMALQRAFQKDKPRTYELLSVIEKECTDKVVLTKILETKAIACRYVGENDSALAYAQELQTQGNREPTGYMIKAQAYSRLGIADSALFYAKYIMENSPNMMDKYNALYILANRDKSISNDSILKLTSLRADIGKEHTLRQESVSHAVELLQQDMKPNYKWVYGAVVTLIITGVIILIVLSVTKKRRAAKHAQLEQVQQQIEMHHQDIYQQLEQECKILRNQTQEQLTATLQWKNYDNMCSYVDARFYGLVSKLRLNYTTLSEQNIRLCVLLFLNIPKQNMAALLYCSPNSIGKLKERTAEKMGTHSAQLYDFLWKMMCK